MNSETRNCQNCKTDFTIEPEDFQFYEKIKVPAPTFCPECRYQRKLAWRNERTLYRRTCDLCSKSIVTMYHPDSPLVVYCSSCWWGDGWDAKSFGQDIDFSRPFFEQFKELQARVPRVALLSKNSINSEYCNHTTNSKNCYLSTAAFNSENVMYSSNTLPGKNCCDVYRVEGAACENLYESINVHNSYNCQFCYVITSSFDCLYSFDLKGCSNCFLSSNLRNKSYCFNNQQLSKEEYFKQLSQFNLASYETRQLLYAKWIDLIKKSLHKSVIGESCVDCTGNFMFNSKNSKHIFDSEKIEDSKYLSVTLDMADSYDVYHGGGTRCERIYESHAIAGDFDAKCIHLSYDNSFVEYCDSVHNSSNLFGCIGIQKGSYCILNKQYPKEEYLLLKEKLIEHMIQTKQYGEFFPMSLSPFGYNETQGMVYLPINKEEALSKNMRWQDNITITKGKQTLIPDDMPDSVMAVSDSITSEVLECIECNKNYNIVTQEIAFYRAMVIPIPRKCPQCRFLQRLALRLPRKLWHRSCMCDVPTHNHERKCQNEFETSYAPNRPEKVFCEGCYQKEVL